MRSWLDLKTACGLLALLATLVLALPGVKAVRAENLAAGPASSDGPQCNPEAPEAKIAQQEVDMRALQARLEARVAAQGGKDANMPILLNNRGYNYGPGRDLDRIAAEAILLRPEK
jgi:hypothetical protein